MDKGRYKKGIALVSAAVIIIVLIMISSLVIYVASDMITESKEAALLNDLEKIEAAVEEYYSVNGTLPVKSDEYEANETSYLADINELDGSEYKDYLEMEIEKNQDNDSTFYEIDMSKIGIEELSYGANNTEKDIYLIASDSHKVYYCKGIKIKGNIYFSDANLVNK